uniref:tetratricopeptide repeat protein n=1 Tax=Amycolatopsis kentuckyensis TaxID=218823 RepID=UPI00356B0278
ELPVYTRLGDTRETALTWGRIADILYQRGEYEEATSLQLKRLETNTGLGDLDGIAAANWDLATIHLAQQDHESAAPRLIESYTILRRLRRADGLAVVALTLASLLAAADRIPEAQHVAGEGLQSATKIGASDLVEQLTNLLDNLSQGNDER